MLLTIRQTTQLPSVCGVYLRVGSNPLGIPPSPMFCTAVTGSYTKSLSITTIAAAGWFKLPNPPDPLPPRILFLDCRKRDLFANINAKPTLSFAIPVRPPWPRARWTDLLHPPELLPMSCFERCRSILWSKSSPSAHQAPSTQAFGPPASNQGLQQLSLLLCIALRIFAKLLVMKSTIMAAIRWSELPNPPDPWPPPTLLLGCCNRVFFAKTNVNFGPCHSHETFMASRALD